MLIVVCSLVVSKSLEAIYKLLLLNVSEENRMENVDLFLFGKESIPKTTDREKDDLSVIIGFGG